MKKLFYALCMSALIFTGCKKSSTPGFDENGTSSEIIKSYCQTYPTNNLCQAIVGKTEASIDEIQPAQKLTAGGTQEIFGSTQPEAWLKGYSNLLPGDYIYDFSVVVGGTMGPDSEFSFYSAKLSNGENAASKPNTSISPIEGGSLTFNYGSEYKGFTVIRVAVFDNEGSYFYLPPLRFAS